MTPASSRSEPGVQTVTETSQARFHRRWDHLQDPHVRALAWLLDAPDLLDPAAPQWAGRIASLSLDLGAGAAGAHEPYRPGQGEVGAWLAALDAAPQALHDHLGMQSVTRLGRYAEKLLAYYFEWRGILAAYGLQVRAARNDTIGEFDFLLREGDALLHLELATKFYLFEAPRAAAAGGADKRDAGTDQGSEKSTAGHDPGQDYIGPNLADTLAAKMDKILNRQLALGQHPAAQAYLPLPLVGAQALIKGWLFYHVGEAPTEDGEPTSAAPGGDADTVPAPAIAAGVAADHCRGSWCSVSEFGVLKTVTDGAGFLPLSRLAWLAPARATGEKVLDHAAMHAQLRQHFTHDTMPLLVASMAREENVWRETARSFVVPDDWRSRVHERNQRTVLRWDRDIDERNARGQRPAQGKPAPD